MTYLFLHPIMHLLLFLSPDWLTFCHVIISHMNSLVSLFIFCFSLTKGQCSKRQTILSALAVHRPFYISICISTLPTQHTTFINIDTPWLRAGPRLYIIAGSVTLNCPLKILNYAIAFSFRTVLVDREVVSFHYVFPKIISRTIM